MKFSTAILTLVLIAAGSAASLSACEESTRVTTYTISRSWVEGHYERDGRCVAWVPGHWVETRVPSETVIIRDGDRRHGGEWRDEHRHGEWRERDDDRGRHAVIIAPVPIPVPIPLPLPIPFFHHR